jgi:DNA invertase Pin-like site-specific DNA recombinase
MNSKTEPPKNNNKVVAYLRTSSSTNVGDNKDSGKRQLVAIKRWCKSNNKKIVAEFYDKNVSGSKNFIDRVELNKAITFCKENNIHMLVVEHSDRFARDLMVQELLVCEMKKSNVDVVAVDNPTLFAEGNQMFRQLYGVINQHNKDLLVGRLRTARERKRIDNKRARQLTLSGDGKCEGAPQFYVEEHPNIVKLCKKLRNQDKWTLNRISLHLLNTKSITNTNGHQLDPKQVSRIINYKRR